MTRIQDRQSVTQRKTASRPGRTRNEAGQALVETALVIPICAALLLGAVEVARIAYAGIEIANAARAGVAFAAQNKNDAAATAPPMNYIAMAAKQEAANVTNVTATSVQMCVCSDGSAPAVLCSKFVTTGCVAPNQIEDEVTVTVTGTINTLFKVPGIPSTLSLTNSATMWVEQQ